MLAAEGIGEASGANARGRSCRGIARHGRARGGLGTSGRSDAGSDKDSGEPSKDDNAVAFEPNPVLETVEDGGSGSHDTYFRLADLVDSDLGEDVAQPEDRLQILPPTALGDPVHCLNYDFVAEATFGGRKSLQDKFAVLSETDLVIALSSAFWSTLLECSNAVDPSAGLTVEDMHYYTAVLTLQATLSLDGIDQYWYPNELISFQAEVADLKNIFPLDRFYHVQRHLKGYKPQDDVPSKSRAWEVKRPLMAVQQSFREVLEIPGEYLSADEGMVEGASTCSPIYVPLGRARPLGGFRFFLLVDCDTRLILWFELDEGQFNTVSCAGRPGGEAGAVITDLCVKAHLPGLWYKVYADDNYNTLQLAEFMKCEYSILVAGTMQRRNPTPLVHLGKAKKFRLSHLHPTGTLHMAMKTATNIYVYGYMDSAAMYFVDPIVGPGHQDTLQQRRDSGAMQRNLVPRLIKQYNTRLHTLAMFDEVKRMFGGGSMWETCSYTVRIFNILQSMILAQAYNIHRAVHGHNPLRRMSHTQFKVSIIRGLLGHQVACPPAPAMQTPAGHELCQWPVGSKNTPDGRRRKSMNCRQCPNVTADGRRNTTRDTTYYCSVCEVGFHPQCFAAFHSANTPFLAPAKKKRCKPEADTYV